MFTGGTYTDYLSSLPQPVPADINQSASGATAGSGVKMDLTTTTELYDFGTDVNVEEPPASQVVDLQDVLGQS